MKAALLLDIGSSGVRGELRCATGEIQRSYSSEYHNPNKNRSEASSAATVSPGEELRENLTLLRQLTDECLAANTAGEPVELCAAGAMHTLLLIDSNGEVLAPLSTWEDVRGGEMCGEYYDYYLSENLYQHTGCPLSPVYPLYRLLWYKKQQPEILKKAAMITSLKSQLIYTLSGRYIEDFAMAGATGFFNYRNLNWQDSLLKRIGISTRQLPEPVAPTHRLESSGPKQNHLDTLLGGSSDGVLAHLGCSGFATKRPSCTMSMGTSGAVRVFPGNFTTQKSSGAWFYPVGGGQLLTGLATNNCGNILAQSTRELYGKRLELTAINEILRETRFNPASLFNPFRAPERLTSRIRNRVGAGQLAELSSKFSREEALRAVIEGVVFNLVELFFRLAYETKPEDIFLTGSLAEIEFARELIELLTAVPVRYDPERTTVLNGAFKLFLEANNYPASPSAPQESKTGNDSYNLELSDYKKKYSEWCAAFIYLPESSP